MRHSGAQRIVSAILAAALLIALPVAAAAAPGRHRDWKAYHAEVVAINREYVAAVNQAKAALSAALASATTAGQRSTARAQYTLAIVVATQQRDQALVALGPAPPAPGQRASFVVSTSGGTTV